MDNTEFRRAGHEMVDWMADYLANIERLPVTPDVRPGDVRSALPPSPPDAPVAAADVMNDFGRLILPGMTHWGHPGFFAYFPANASPPSILAEMLTATLGAQCMSWQTSPAATELEQVTMEWLRQMLGLPGTFTGVIQDTSSTATLVALLSARERATGYVSAELGLRALPQQLVVYASRERHSSVDKAVRLAGYGLEALRLIDVDADYAMRPERLEEAIVSDVAEGFRPAAIVATTGTTSSTGLDPLRAIGEIAGRHGAWLHVDASYAGSAAILPEKRWIIDGVELADSFVFNPHKWMMVNFDCSAYFVRDIEALQRTFAASPEYLRTVHDAEVVNFRDWGIQLGRRFRALKLWWVIRTYGVEGLQAMLRRHCEWAREFATWVAADPRFEILAPVHLGLVCFRLRPGEGESLEAVNERNRQLLARVNASRRVYLTHTMLEDRYTIRMAIGARATELHHVQEAWELITSGA
jgi:aromatic-L-amino-acid/L-tryptophan decarboxylase